MSKGTQGKWAEDRVRDWLKKYKEAHASFTFNRILDARSARGAMSNPQPGDFQWFMDCGRVAMVESSDSRLTQCRYTRNGVIEVKSVENSHRLPYGNFNPDQVGRLRIRQMAGSETMVIVAFRPEGYAPYWRTAPLEYFEARERKGSWDMSDIDAYSHCDDLLEMMLK